MPVGYSQVSRNCSLLSFLVNSMERAGVHVGARSPLYRCVQADWQPSRCPRQAVEGSRFQLWSPWRGETNVSHRILPLRSPDLASFLLSWCLLWDVSERYEPFEGTALRSCRYLLSGWQKFGHVSSRGAA